MEFLARTKSGIEVRLTVERDKNSVYQVYARFPSSDRAEEEKLLCLRWGAVKMEDGIHEGVYAVGRLIEIPRNAWEGVLAEREDLRDRDNLEDIRLVKIFSKGNLKTIDGYTLSARVDRETWKKIEHCMREEDSGVNDEIQAGDHFVGWIVKKGREEEVERLLGVKPESSIRA